jgi:hypothetical protein
MTTNLECIFCRRSGAIGWQRDGVCRDCAYTVGSVVGATDAEIDLMVERDAPRRLDAAMRALAKKLEVDIAPLDPVVTGRFGYRISTMHNGKRHELTVERKRHWDETTYEQVATQAFTTAVKRMREAKP